MEELNTSSLDLDIEEALKTFNFLENSINENSVKEENRFEEKIEGSERQFTQLLEKKSALISKLERQTEIIKNYEYELLKLKELNISQEVSNWKLKAESIKEERESLEEILNKKRLQLEEKRKENRSKASSAIKNKKKDEIELTANIKYTQLELSTEKADNIKFSFKCVSQIDPEKIFYFVLYISDSGVYSVPDCQPTIPNLDSILAKLNSDRDMFTFIKRMRKAFVEISETF